MMFKKVLVCCPTSVVKDYCFEAWLDNVMSFNYPNYVVRMFDNSSDNGENAKKLNSIYKRKYGDNKKFLATNSFKLNNTRGLIRTLQERVCLSHNDCRNEFLKGDYDLMLHLESDVFCPSDTIEKLMFSNKKVIGALFYIDEGINRRIMVQRRIFRAPKNIMTVNYKPNEDMSLVNGELKRVPHLGLGCVLIQKIVFNKIKFRFKTGSPEFPDSFFAEDCFMNGIHIYADTSIICEHRNSNWEEISKKFSNREI